MLRHYSCRGSTLYTGKAWQWCPSTEVHGGGVQNYGLAVVLQDKAVLDERSVRSIGGRLVLVLLLVAGNNCNLRSVTPRINCKAGGIWGQGGTGPCA